MGKRYDPMVKQRTTLVLGVSTNPERYSYRVIQQLVQAKQPVVALGLKPATVFGIPIEQPFKHFEGIHTISLYIGSKHQPEYYDYILKLNPKRVIFNPGTENSNFASLLKEHHIAWENACTLVLLATNQYQA